MFRLRVKPVMYDTPIGKYYEAVQSRLYNTGLVTLSITKWLQLLSKISDQVCTDGFRAFITHHSAWLPFTVHVYGVLLIYCRFYTE